MHRTQHIKSQQQQNPKTLDTPGRSKANSPHKLDGCTDQNETTCSICHSGSTGSTQKKLDQSHKQTKLDVNGGCGKQNSRPWTLHARCMCRGAHSGAAALKRKCCSTMPGAANLQTKSQTKHTEICIVQNVQIRASTCCNEGKTRIMRS